MEKFFEAYENGTDYDAVVDKAVDVIEGSFANQPMASHVKCSLG